MRLYVIVSSLGQIRCRNILSFGVSDKDAGQGGCKRMTIAKREECEKMAEKQITYKDGTDVSSAFSANLNPLPRMTQFCGGWSNCQHLMRVARVLDLGGS
jgi:hypothetical protein